MSNFNPMNLGGRVVLVTGASSGIGRATSVLLSRLGARLAICARDEGRLTETLGMLEGTGHLTFPFDLMRTDDIPGWVRSVVEEIGCLDGLVHCAGIHGILTIRAANAEKIETMMRVNVLSALLLARGICEPGCRGTKASIVFVSSVAAISGSPALSVYASSKAALLGITKSLAAELARDGIRVNCVTSGMVRSELTNRLEEQLLPSQFEAIESRHPLGIGSPDDVANAIAFLVADTGRWITGTSLVVDGGYTSV